MATYIDDIVFIPSDPLVNSRIKEYLHIICRSINNSYKGVQSIILYGSFARGDACFSHVNPEEPIYASDLDILVYTPYPYPKMLQRDMPIELKKISEHIHIDLQFTRKLPAEHKRPLKDHLDIQMTAKTLCGAKVIDPKQKLTKNLSSTEGLRLIFNRMYTLLPFLYRLHSKNKKVHDELSIKKAAKIIQDCCQSLLILSKRYDGLASPTFKKTMEYIDTDHPLLLEIMPSFKEPTVWAQDVLTNLDDHQIPADEALFWARETLLACVKYFLVILYNIRHDDLHNIITSFLAAQSNIYISSMLHYNLRLLLQYKKIYPAAFKTLFIPACYYWYAALFCMIEGHGKQEEKQSHYFDSALKLLKQVYPVPGSSIPSGKDTGMKYEFYYKTLRQAAQVSLQIV